MTPNNGPRKPTPPQPAETATKTSGRLRRIAEVRPEQREKIQPLFDKGMTVERIAELFEINISPVQLLEHVVREYVGAKHPGPFVMRKSARSEGSVRESLPFLRRMSA